MEMSGSSGQRMGLYHDSVVEALIADGWTKLLAEIDRERVLFLAVPVYAWKGLFSSPLGQLIAGRYQLRFLVFDEVVRRIDPWIG